MKTLMEDYSRTNVLAVPVAGQPELKKTWRKPRTITWKFCDSTKDYPEIGGTPKITSPALLYQNFRSIFHNEVKEKFVVFWLSSSNKVIGFEVISEGNLNSSIVHPREVFRGAIVATCASIIIAHNHPSGNSDPSSEDVQITKRIVEASKILDIPLFDHIIFTNDSYCSFVERHLI
jgi:DNA repair protein RadC